MPRFSLYGVTFDSEFPIQGLEVSASPPDAFIRLESFDMPDLVENNPGYHTWIEADLAFVRVRDSVSFKVVSGRHIYCQPSSDIGLDYVASYLLGCPMGLLLRQRGFLVLHGSAVETNGGVVVFLGGSGWGKSTLAAALQCTGICQFFTDDLMVIRPNKNRSLLACHAPPRMNINEEVSQRLLGENTKHLGSRIKVLKRCCLARNAYRGGPLKIHAIYVLGKGKSIEVSRLQRSQALIELVRHTYATRTCRLTRPDWHFELCGLLAATTPAFSLRRPADMDMLGMSVERVLEGIRSNWENDAHAAVPSLNSLGVGGGAAGEREVEM